MHYAREAESGGADNQMGGGGGRSSPARRAARQETGGRGQRGGQADGRWRWEVKANEVDRPTQAARRCVKLLD